jgi:hypothetical protein
MSTGSAPSNGTIVTKSTSVAIEEAPPAAAPSPAPSPAPNPLLAGLPTDQDIAQATQFLDDVVGLLGGNATPQTSTQRRRSLKFKKGGEPIVGLLAGLAIQYDVRLPGVDPLRMQANLVLAQRLQALDTKCRAVAALVSDTLRAAKSGAWQGTTALYTALTRASSQSPALQKELQPAVVFFKRTPAAKKGGPKLPPKPSAKKLKEAQKVMEAAAAHGEVAPPLAIATPAVAPADGTGNGGAPGK